MFKKLKIVVAISSILLMIAPITAFAATSNFGYFGTTSGETDALWADITYYDDYWTNVTAYGNGTIIWLNDSGRFSTSAITPGIAVTAPSGAKGFRLSSNGGEVYATIAHSTNPNADTVIFTGSSSGGGSGGNCDCICHCPEWGNYMGKLDDILFAIPPAPNWNAVADVFKNSIAPQIKSDLSDLLGSVKGTPPLPSKPQTPDLVDDLDDRGIKEPTGKEDSQLGNSTFSADDIKNNAPTIPVREDPTGGGFSIIDPVGSLPTIEEFKQNKPNEGVADLPQNPTENGSAPFPSQGSNTPPIPSGNGSGNIGSPPIPNESWNPPTPNNNGSPPIPNESWNPPTLSK